MSTLNTYNLKSPDSANTNLALDASGNVAIQAGSASTPSVYVTGDANTGLYSPGADQIAVATGGTARLYVDASGRVGIGDNAPGTFDVRGAKLTLADSVSDGIGIKGRRDSLDRWYVGYNSSDQLEINQIRNNALAFKTNNAEVARLTNSGQLLVGTSSARASSVWDEPVLQIEGTTYQRASLSVINNQNSAAEPGIILGKSRGTTLGSNTVVQSGDFLGTIAFQGSDGSSLLRGAQISCAVDGTPGTNDMPGRLVFSTTADGASSPTERMRITQAGYTRAAANAATTLNYGHEFADNSVDTITFSVNQRNTSFAQGGGGMLLVNCARAANSAYTFLGVYSGDLGDREFNLRGDGNAFADGTWTGGGADYAEYFEWSDSNPTAEDRRGISVVLDGDKIREAQAGEDPIGVISGNPSVVGDAAWNKWSGKYLRDEFGTYVLEDYEVTDEDGNNVIQQRRKLNPAYDPDQPYQSREERPEWDCVGLMGKLRIRKGQVTGSRWIKMRNISDSVEEWLVR